MWGAVIETKALNQMSSRIAELEQETTGVREQEIKALCSDLFNVTDMNIDSSKLVSR